MKEITDMTQVNADVGICRNHIIHFGAVHMNSETLIYPQGRTATSARSPTAQFHWYDEICGAPMLRPGLRLDGDSERIEHTRGDRRYGPVSAICHTDFVTESIVDCTGNRE
jgi:hypothetical protein